MEDKKNQKKSVTKKSIKSRAQNLNLSKMSATIVVKDGEKYITECLDSLRLFDEVILLDNNSNDNTLKIAKRYKNVKIYHTDFIGFGSMKNLAVKYTRNDWILSIDSDEVLEGKLIEEIKKIELGKNLIYSISRKNLYRGEWIRACGWYPDFVSRIFNKNFTKFNDNEVHESLIVPKNGAVKRLTSHIRHYPFDNIQQLISKMDFYSTLWAKNNIKKSSSPLKAIFRATWTFFRNYFFKRGFLYGYSGFIISYCNASGTFFKYMKLYENRLIDSENKKESNG